MDILYAVLVLFLTDVVKSAWILNRILNLCRQSKKNYYQLYFTENAKNLQQMWKGIKNIININNKSNG